MQNIILDGVLFQPFKVIETRLKCNTDPYLIRDNPHLLDYADKLTIRQGRFVLWKGIVPNILRKSLSVLIKSSKRSKSNKPLSWVAYIGLTVVEAGLYFLSVALKTDNQTKCDDLLSLFGQTTENKNNFINIGISILLYLFSKQVNLIIQEKLKINIRRTGFGFEKYMIIRSILLMANLPLDTICDRMIANQMTILQACSQYDFFAGYKAVLWKLPFEYMFYKIQMH